MKHGANPLKAKLNSTNASAPAKVFVGYKKGVPITASWKIEEVREQLRRFRNTADVTCRDVEIKELSVPQAEMYSYKKMSVTDFVEKYKA